MHRQTMGITAFDQHWFHVVNNWTQVNPFLNDLGKIVAKGAPELWALVFLVLWFWPPRVRSQTREAVVFAIVAGAFALVINLVLGHFFYRPRPFVFEPQEVHQLLQHARDSSFPSDHAAGSFGFATGLFYARTRDGIYGILFAAAVAVARVFVGLHWPTDVLAGAGIGIIAGVVVLGLRHQLKWLVNLGYAIFRFPPPVSRYRSRLRMD